MIKQICVEHDIGDRVFNLMNTVLLHDWVTSR